MPQLLTGAEPPSPLDVLKRSHGELMIRTGRR